jgi:hypothetical protein
MRKTPKRATRAGAVPIPAAPWLVEVAPRLLGDHAALARAVRRYRTALSGYDGPVVICATSSWMPASVEPAIYDAPHGHA